MRAVNLLHEFFGNYDRGDLDEALQLLAQYHRIAPPRIAWCREYRIDGGRASMMLVAGGTSERPTATIRTVHPRRWRYSENKWVAYFLHELGHWADAAAQEERAEQYAQQILEAWSRRDGGG